MHKFDIESEMLNKYILKNNMMNVPPYFRNSLSFALLKYNVGGEFIKHRDKLLSKFNDYYLHSHTCLLYPPSHISKYGGGNLILYDEKDKQTIINTSQFKNWTFIIFNRKTYHEITPVTSGQRYVFKTQLFIKNFDYRSPIPILNKQDGIIEDLCD
jgi:predicted 2-oxoglutarate/Fe(II)-dependent dioxygenase YbiX